MCDDIFGLTPSWVQNFNTLVKSRKLNFKYKIQSRVDLLLQDDTLEALAQSRWREIQPVAHQVLWAMDRTLDLPDCGLVLGQAAPWIKVLSMEERLIAASRLTHPALRKMTRAWAGPGVDPIE
jgi:hypothetical protein